MDGFDKGAGGKEEFIVPVFFDGFFCTIRGDVENENAGLIVLADNFGNFCSCGEDTGTKIEVFSFIFHIALGVKKTANKPLASKCVHSAVSLVRYGTGVLSVLPDYFRIPSIFKCVNRSDCCDAPILFNYINFRAYFMVLLRKLVA